MAAAWSLRRSWPGMWGYIDDRVICAGDTGGRGDQGSLDPPTTMEALNLNKNLVKDLAGAGLTEAAGRT
jgi:hypothetical protein